MRRKVALGMALLLTAPYMTGCSDAVAPAPLTLERAQEAVDREAAAVSWAVRDLWSVGGRDVVVSVQLGGVRQAPRYFVSRQVAVGGQDQLVDLAIVARHVAALEAVLERLQVAMDALWELGSRDVVVSVQDRPELPPHYFRYPVGAP